MRAQEQGRQVDPWQRVWWSSTDLAKVPCRHILVVAFGQESLEEVERPVLMVDRKASLIPLACHKELQERLLVVGALKEPQRHLMVNFQTEDAHQVAAEEAE